MRPTFGEAALDSPPFRGTILAPEFFARPSDHAAPELIGKILWRTGVGGGRLTEVEAYLPRDDPASHSFRGMTGRNAAMFGPPGRMYVYLSYGIHVMLNLVCDAEAVGSAVLIRSFEPTGDIATLAVNRFGQRPLTEGAILKSLACGPGRVGQALALQLSMDGLALGADSGISVIDDGFRPVVDRSPRIGITKGREMLLRYFAIDSPYVT